MDKNGPYSPLLFLAGNSAESIGLIGFPLGVKGLECFSHVSSLGCCQYSINYTVSQNNKFFGEEIPVSPLIVPG